MLRTLAQPLSGNRSCPQTLSSSSLLRPTPPNYATVKHAVSSTAVISNIARELELPHSIGINHCRATAMACLPYAHRCPEHDRDARRPPELRGGGHERYWTYAAWAGASAGHSLLPRHPP